MMTLSCLVHVSNVAELRVCHGALGSASAADCLQGLEGPCDNSVEVGVVIN